VRGPSSPRRSVLVFVHGIFGDALGTWTNVRGVPFWDVMKHDKILGGFDVFVLGFKSDFFNSASSLSVTEVVAHLANVVSHEGLDDYPVIIFVYHSMGGLVVLQYLLDYPAIRAKVPMLYLYSTPLEGSRLAELARYILKNPGLRDLIVGRERNENRFLDDLDRRWALEKERQPEIHPHVYCAYETEKIAGRYVVDKTSATRLCQGTRTPITRNHIQMIRPTRGDDDAITGLSAYVKVRTTSKADLTAQNPSHPNTLEVKGDG